MKSANFSKIVVIQSLGENDFHTGIKLHEDIDVLNVAYDKGLKVEFVDVLDKVGLIKCLEDQIVDAQVSGFRPLLHIEAHGSAEKDGLVLKNGFISWQELKEPLTKLNELTKCHLIVVFAACYGAHFLSCLSVIDRAPCWAAIGPKKTLSAESILSSFTAFYREILETGKGGKAVRLLNETLSKVETPYLFIPAESFFTKVYQGYLSIYCSPEALNNRARKMSRKLKKIGAVKQPGKGHLKRMLKSTQEGSFLKYKRHFFMMDIYPENELRFTVEYLDIVA
tara:strand:- start:2482 stop:3324 length:843 start_codon:yes stop_codon:yes gene_type:complete